ncbi:hypothetical protein ACWEDZ_32290 [Streptomyces sp. NPDC005047]
MARKQKFEAEVVVRFKVSHTDGPRPVSLGDLHQWMEEEWEGLSANFQGDEEKDEETEVELSVVSFEEVSTEA